MEVTRANPMKRRGFLRALGAGAATATLAACAAPAAQSKSTDQNKAVVQKFADQINAKDLDGALKLISPNFVERSAMPGMPTGPESVRAWFTELFAGFPDHRATILDLIAEGDKVVAMMSSEGTNSGTFLGIPPTGKRATWMFVDIHRIVDGKFVEHWNVSDQLSMLQQLGLVPPP